MITFNALLKKIEAVRGAMTRQQQEAPETQHIGVLFHGGPDEDDDREIQENFDFWFHCLTPEAILDVDDDRLIICDTEEELVASLEARYPTLPGCTLLDHYSGEMKHARTAEEDRWSRRRRYSYNRTDRKVHGWMVLKTPLLSDPIDLDHLRDFCVTNGAVLVEPSKLSSFYRNEPFNRLSHSDDINKRLMQDGFSPMPGQNGNTKLIWNPKKVQLRKWRQTVREVEAKQKDHFPEEVMKDLGYAVSPTNWPDGMPFEGLIHGAMSRRGGGYHDTYYQSPDYDASMILSYIDLARRLKKGSTPWRDTYSRCGTNKITKGITEAAPFCRYVAKHGGDAHEKKLARWIMKEAKHAKIEIPPLPKAPPKPFARKVKRKPQVVQPVLPPLTMSTPEDCEQCVEANLPELMNAA